MAIRSPLYRKKTDSHVATLLGMTVVYVGAILESPATAQTIFLRHCEGVSPWQSVLLLPPGTIVP